ncbi:hypothetical protein WH47_09115 [Habropoda laboriosa]|uniref:Uncharacterized protein n=1 Tax=Habropoda laboriosa TaxID=597456 RepID=A0A0L7RG26_9HYME|nr:hypothetical protein WH47_09115 [Habropoda laboriosa]
MDRENEGELPARKELNYQARRKVQPLKINRLPKIGNQTRVDSVTFVGGVKEDFKFGDMLDLGYLVGLVVEGSNEETEGVKIAFEVRDYKFDAYFFILAIVHSEGVKIAFEVRDYKVSEYV